MPLAITIVVPGAAVLTAFCNCASVQTFTTAPAGAGRGGALADEAECSDVEGVIETAAANSQTSSLRDLRQFKGILRFFSRFVRELDGPTGAIPLPQQVTLVVTSNGVNRRYGLPLSVPPPNSAVSSRLHGRSKNLGKPPCRGSAVVS